MARLHLQLDPVGGMAGDMFIAAVLDAFPSLEDGLLRAIRAAGLPQSVSVSVERHRDHAVTGLRFLVGEQRQNGPIKHRHGAYTQIVSRLASASLPGPVRDHAISIFRLLAEAEAKVHGVAIDDVTFHELGEWDSIADVVGSAHAIATLEASWSVGALPLGTGRVRSAHGLLPVPAPATVLLLQGFECFDDGIGGERVTPTGAAILRHLHANGSRRIGARRLCGSGTGFGARRLAGLSNVLRLLAFETARAPAGSDHVAEVSFEVDDQSPEDLATALDRIRVHPAVKDAISIAGVGKKGRLIIQVRVLADPSQLESVCATCLDETTTIGLRYQLVERVTLRRREERVRAGGRSVGVKIVDRNGEPTVKVDADDLARLPGGRANRERVRREVEAGVLPRDERQ